MKKAANRCFCPGRSHMAFGCPPTAEHTRACSKAVPKALLVVDLQRGGQQRWGSGVAAPTLQSSSSPERLAWPHPDLPPWSQETALFSRPFLGGLRPSGGVNLGLPPS